MPDPYAILGIPPSANADEVRAAFRRQARRFHPDVSKEPDAAARFAAVAAAYEQLTAPPDRRTPDAAPPAPGPAPGPRASVADEVDREEAAEVYDAFFTGREASSRAGSRNADRAPSPFRPIPGSRDVALDLPLAPSEAAEGVGVTVPTPAGPHHLVVPPGTRDGAEFRLVGLGSPGRPRAGQAQARADLLVRVRIVPGSGAGLDERSGSPPA